jgi:predicted nucleotidyltransferase
MRQQRSSGSVQIISINRDELLARLSAIARRICVEHPEVRSVRVFGSVGRGDQVGTSDVDVLVVLRGTESVDTLGQIRLFYPYFDLPIGVDVLAYTEGEIDRRLQAGDAFMARVWKESLLLC